jgi:C4-dicarboxylate transporter/malic acid transport protein
MKTVRSVISAISPGWFTSVMGTGILGLGLASAPFAIPGAAVAGLAVWWLAALIFLVIAPLLVLRAIVAPAGLIATLRDHATAQLWGAPPMAAFTLANGLVLIVAPHGGGEIAIATAHVLWAIGVVLSLLSAFVVPYHMMTTHELDPKDALGTWLLPVVPPIVASVPSALLLPTFPVALRSSILGLAYGMLGLGLALAALTIAVFYSRLLFAKVPRGALATSMWLVVGPLGQSIAGACALGTSANLVWPHLGRVLHDTGVAYGMLTWGFAIYWLVLAIVTTLRAVRAGLPFTLGWWSFTFPVGVLTAGSNALYAGTGAALFGFADVVLLAILGAGWLIVATRTAHNVIRALSHAPSTADAERRDRPQAASRSTRAPRAMVPHHGVERR